VPPLPPAIRERRPELAYKIFIDGQEGTTGLRIAERLRSRAEFELLPIAEHERKDRAARLERIYSADVSILCLPDTEARDIASEVGFRARLIDCSTAHRMDSSWLYGMPEVFEFEVGGGKDVSLWTTAQHVANPGCHATGFIIAVRPLVEVGIIPSDCFITCHSLTGYSGGGKKMIAEYESERGNEYRRRLPIDAPRRYGLSQNHKHLPEMQLYSGLSQPPSFAPIVADFFNGMMVCVPLPIEALRKGVTAKDVRDALTTWYHGCPLVHVRPDGYDPEDGFLAANAYADRDDLEVIVAGTSPRIDVICRFDNLGKGASGAAIQNLNLMLGLPETEGLVVSD